MDIREAGGSQRRLLFAAESPDNKRLRETRLRELVGRIWPEAKVVSYSGGVGRFEVGSATGVAHFAPVRGGVELLPVEETGSALLRDDEAHLTNVAPGSRGVELQLRLLRFLLRHFVGCGWIRQRLHSEDPPPLGHVLGGTGEVVALPVLHAERLESLNHASGLDALGDHDVVHLPGEGEERGR